MDGQPRQPQDDDALQNASLSPEEVDRWCEQAAAAPDLRMTKVMRVRRAIVSRSYDEDAGLEHSLDDIHDDLGVEDDLGDEVP